MKKQYEEKVKDMKEKRKVKVEAGEDIDIEYKHYPNIVGPRSKYTGLPIWVGKTEATANGTTVNAYCWLKEPYTYSRGRVVTTGRLLKQFGLSTSLAEQVEE